MRWFKREEREGKPDLNPEVFSAYLTAVLDSSRAAFDYERARKAEGIDLRHGWVLSPDQEREIENARRLTGRRELYELEARRKKQDAELLRQSLESVRKEMPENTTNDALMDEVARRVRVVTDLTGVKPTPSGDVGRSLNQYRQLRERFIK